MSFVISVFMNPKSGWVAGLLEGSQLILRMGDVITRFSAVQWLVLLPGCTPISAERVMERLKAKYGQLPIREHAELTYWIGDTQTLIEEELEKEEKEARKLIETKKRK